MNAPARAELGLPPRYRRADETRIGVLYGISLIAGGAAAGAAAYWRYWILEQIGDHSILELAPPQVRDFLALDPSATALQASFWLKKLLFAGPIPYAIIAVTLTALVYILLIALSRTSPWYGSYGAVKRLRRTIKEMRPGQASSPASLLALSHQRSRPNRWFDTRFQLLERVWSTSRGPSALHEANDRYTAYQEALLGQAIRPLVHAEWALPILGFIGTVWGVTEAVEGLRLAVDALFEQRELTREVVDYFGLGFRGLILAFDTTLFGLVGLGLVGTLTFLFQKGAMAVILAMDRWAGEAINLLPEQDRLEMLIRGLFTLEEDGELSKGEDGAPVLRARAWQKDVLAALAKTDKELQPERDEDGRPVPRWQEPLQDLLTGLFETDEKGQLVRGSANAPVSRAKRWRELVLQEFYATDASGTVIFDEATGQPISKSEQWRIWATRAAIREIYEVTDEEAEQIADGVLETGENVRLRSRLERRNREHLAQRHGLLSLVYEILKRLESGNEGGGGASSNQLIEFLEGSGAAVETLAVNGRQIAVSRQASPGGYEHRILAFEMQAIVPGAPLQPVEIAVAQPSGGPVSLAIWGDRAVFVDEEGARLETMTLDGALDTQSDCFLGDVGAPWALLCGEVDDVRSVVAAHAEADGRPAFGALPLADMSHAWRNLGFALPGVVTAAAGSSAGPFAISTESGPAGAVFVAARLDGDWRDWSLPWAASGLAWEPGEEVLWAYGGAGQLARIDRQAGDVKARDIGVRLSGVAATGCGQLLGIEAVSGRLFVIPTEVGSPPFPAPLDRPARRIAAAPEAGGIAIGFADGSAALWRIVEPFE